MPYVANHFYRIRAYSYNTNTSQVCINTTYWRAGPLTGPVITDQEMVATAGIYLAPFHKATMPSNVDFVGVDIQDVTTAPYPVATGTSLSGGPGTYASTNVVANQVSGIISFKTAFAGPGYRGRIYPGFVPVGAMDAAGRMTAAYEVIVQQLASALQTGIDMTQHGSTGFLSLQVRRRVGILPVPPLPPFFFYEFNPVLRCAAPTRFATQRRRGQFGRINPLPVLQ